MKVPVSWLKDFVDIDLPLNEIARRLTLNGLETTVEYRVEIDEKIVLGEIKAVMPHPDADRLRLATVNYGRGEATVVCGAPNLNVGDKVAFAQMGSKVKNGEKTVVLEAAKIRGVESCGMICAEDELGVGTSHEGIMVFNTTEPLGMPIAAILAEPILDVEITPNRADCMSILGIAYEVAATMGKEVKTPPSDYEAEETLVRDKIKARIIDPEVSLYYSVGYIGGLKVEPSPEWMQDRLLAVGVRPINNVVDITNYVLMEWGQPLHAFDYDKLGNKYLTVRKAKDGDKFLALDGKEYTLTADMGVIDDGETHVAVAGVIGGLDSSISETTTSIVLEAANFNAASVHNTAKALKISTESSTRFERGVSQRLANVAIKRAMYLILQVAGGTATRGILTDVLKDVPTRTISVNLYKVRKDLGMEDDQVWSNLRLQTALKKMSLKWMPTSVDEEYGSGSTNPNDHFDGIVTVPDHRSDVNNYSDILEEIARGVGYDNLPVRMMKSDLPDARHSEVYLAKEKARAVMTYCGFYEIITHGLTDINDLKKTKPNVDEIKPIPLKVLNSMAVGQDYLRTNMRAALLNTIRENRKYNDGAMKLYEMGHVFIPRGEGVLPLEPDMIYAAVVGDKSGISWPEKAQKVDFYTAKGCADALLEAFNIQGTYVDGTDDGLAEGNRADILVDGKKIGVVGQVHPQVASNFEVNEPVYMLNFSLPAIIALSSPKRDYHPINRFPTSERDIALVVDQNVTCAALLDEMSGPLVQNGRLFDVYQGKQVPEGKKSLAFNLTFQADGRTLTDKEVDAALNDILKNLKEKYGAELRA